MIYNQLNKKYITFYRENNDVGHIMLLLNVTMKFIPADRLFPETS